MKNLNSYIPLPVFWFLHHCCHRIRQGQVAVNVVFVVIVVVVVVVYWA